MYVKVALKAIYGYCSMVTLADQAIILVQMFLLLHLLGESSLPRL